MKVDTSQWKKFLVKDLFETTHNGKNVPTGAWISKKDLSPGSIPRITVTGLNNGIVEYYAFVDSPNYRTYENFISVSFLGTVFYQEGTASLDMKVHCLKPNNIVLNKNIGGFLVTVIRESIIHYKYADQLSSEVLAGLEIMLPVDDDDNPDWGYMDSFMNGVIKESRRIIEQYLNISFATDQISRDEWSCFVISDLFHVVKGTRLTRAEMLEGNIPFIGACITNNGISNQVGNTEHVHQGNLITVAYNGAVATGKAFYQPNPFWASDDVAVFYPRFDLNRNIALFLVPLIEKAGEKFHYDEKWTKPEMEQSVIYLPATQDGSPDWKYMEAYMQDLMAETDTRLTDLNKILIQI